ncbi:hypothetical protein [Geopseudomonas aromaticivorans]
MMHSPSTAKRYLVLAPLTEAASNRKILPITSPPSSGLRQYQGADYAPVKLRVQAMLKNRANLLQGNPATGRLLNGELSVIATLLVVFYVLGLLIDGPKPHWALALASLAFLVARGVWNQKYPIEDAKVRPSLRLADGNVDGESK